MTPAKKVTPYELLLQAIDKAEQLHVDLMITVGTLPPQISEEGVLGAALHLERAIAGLRRVRETIDAWAGRETPRSQALAITKGSR